MSGGSRDRSSRAVGLCLSVVNVVPLPLARDLGRDYSVGSLYTPWLTCPCAPDPPLFVFAVRVYMLGTSGIVIAAEDGFLAGGVDGGGGGGRE